MEFNSKMKYSKVIDKLINVNSVSEQLHLFKGSDMSNKSGNKSKNVYTPVKSLAHTAPYKIHKYFARRPWNVFSEIIKSFSNENEIVLDPFCGGGVTLYEGLKLNRKVVGYDLNPLSVFVVNNMVVKGDNIKHLFGSFKSIIEKLRKINDPYPYFRGLLSELGEEINLIEFNQPKRLMGETKNNFFTLYDIGM